MKAAWATADITPRHPVPLAGYRSRSGTCEAIHDSLEANALLLVSGDRRVFLLSLDLLYPGPAAVATVEKALAPHGIGADDIFITASHTHFAPASDPEMQTLGRVDDRYLAYLTARLAELVQQVVTAPRVEVSLTHHREHLPLGVNRRRPWPLPVVRRRSIVTRPILIAPNKKGCRDDSGDVISVRRAEDGKLLVLLWRFACHPVGFPHRQCVSAEYPGVVRRALREACREAIPVLFWQGFGGNIRPTLGTVPRLRQLWLLPLRGPSFATVTDSEWRSWTRQLAMPMAAAVGGSAPKARLDEELVTAAYSVPVARFIGGTTSRKSLRVQRLSFGSTLTILFTSAEMMVEHAASLGAFGKRAFGVGYSGDVFGYFPTDAQVREGGYEAVGWLAAFDAGSSYTESLDALWQEALAAVTSRTAPRSAPRAYQELRAHQE